MTETGRKAGMVRAMVMGLLLCSGSVQANKDMLAAREAYRTGNLGALASYSTSMSNDPLGAYPRYWLASRQLEAQDDSGVASFLKEQDGSYLAERLRGDYLRALGKRGDWAAFRREYPRLQEPGAIDLACYNYSARMDAGDKKVLDEARRELWLTAKDMPAACDPVFNALVQSRTVLEADIWDRLQLALESNAQGLARHLSRLLGQEVPAATLSGIVANPARYLANPPLATRLDREIAIFAISRQARANLDTALEQLQALQDALGREARYGWRVLGVAGARNTDGRAAEWFAKSGDYPWTDTQREWRIRAALRAGDWEAALEHITRLSPAFRSIRTWQYWEARALEARKRGAEANRLYAALSTDDDYYGLLARDRIGPVAGSSPQSYKLSGDDWKQVRDNASLQRALLLYEMDLRAEAAREFNWGLRGASDPLLLAAAEQASAVGWYDRSIYAAERTRSQHNYALRYPLPYRDSARAYSKEVGLDEAWVYGLMRQESRFASTARSSVGASGLMQLMPATAQWVAKRIGVKYSAQALNDSDTNIRFGTYYLRHVQDKLAGSALLATAGYNAGPNRARAWQADAAMEAAIYVDTAPFLETRDYMRKVMANAVLYGMMLGRGRQGLTDRMGLVPARNPQVIDGP